MLLVEALGEVVPCCGSNNQLLHIDSKQNSICIP